MVHIQASHEVSALDLVSAQTSEIGKVRSELEALKTQLDEHVAMQNEHANTEVLREEIQSLLRLRGREDQKQLDRLQKKLMEAEVNKAGLRQQLTEARNALCEAISQREQLIVEYGQACEGKESLLDEVKAVKANSEIERDAFIKQLAEVEQSLASTNAQLDDMHEYTITLQKDQEWYEKELTQSCETISTLLRELSEQEEVCRRSQDELAAARTRGSGLNRWLLHSTQADLGRVQERNTVLEAELAQVVDELSECRIELARLGSLHEKNAQNAPLFNGSGTDEILCETCASGSVTQDSQFSVAPEGTMENIFRALSSRLPDLEDVRKIFDIRSIGIVTADEFIWAQCPDLAFFVKPAQILGKNGAWKGCGNKSIKRLQKEGAAELIPHFSGAYYYVGSYTVGKQERLTLQEFEQLPEKVQRHLIMSSGKPSKYHELREMYFSGRLTAFKFSVRRVGFNSKLHERLRQLA